MSAWRTDDLASVMMANSNQFAGYTQGIIKQWNPSTFENVVTFGGADHQNVAVTSGVEALTYQPGDVVVLARWAPSGGGMASYSIMGRWLTPAAGRATDAVAFLTTRLAKALARQVIAEGVHSAIEGSQTTTSSTTFGDGTVAGPTLTGVEVSETGLCLVLWGANLDAGPITDGGQIGGHMSIEVSGASSIAASLARAYHVGQSVTVTGATTWSHRASGRALAGDLLTGLNPGVHTIQGKYASQSGGQTVAFSNRLIIAIGL